MGVVQAGPLALFNSEIYAVIHQGSAGRMEALIRHPVVPMPSNPSTTASLVQSKPLTGSLPRHWSINARVLLEPKLDPPAIVRREWWILFVLISSHLIDGE